MSALPAARLHVTPRVGVQGEPTSKEDCPSIVARTLKALILKTFLYSNFMMQLIIGCTRALTVVLLRFCSRKSTVGRTALGIFSKVLYI